LDERLLVVLKDRACQTAGCPECGNLILPPQEPALPIVYKSEYAVTLIGWIGLQHLTKGRSFPDLHKDLEMRGVRISERHVTNLYQVFQALASCVDADSEALRCILRTQGRLSLAIDAVKLDATSPMLYVVRDVISKRVLYSLRTDCHDGETLIRLLLKVKQLADDLRIPIVGVVSDKEGGEVAAVKAALPGIRHQLCQTHYLKNLAKAMADDVSLLGKQVADGLTDLRKLKRELPHMESKTRASTAEVKATQELLECAMAAAQTSGDSILDPPALKRYVQMQEIAETAQQIAAMPGQWLLLNSLISILANLGSWKNMAQRLAEQVGILRTVARILKEGGTSDWVAGRLSEFITSQGHWCFQTALDKPASYFIDKLFTVSNNYWGGLFHCYDHPDIPPTNNDIEQFFGEIKRQERKATGRKRLSGGPLETCAEMHVEAFATVRACSDFQELINGVSPACLHEARLRLQKLAAPAKFKRRYQRKPSQTLETVFLNCQEACGKAI